MHTPTSEQQFDFVNVDSASDIADGTGRAFEIGERTVAVFRVGDSYYAIDNSCPHMGASLADGFVENCVVTCPWHAWRFDIRDGTWRDNPRVKIDSFPVRIVEGRIYIGVPRTSAASGETKTSTLPENPTVRLDQSVQSSVETSVPRELTIEDFQQLIRKMYYEKDLARGVEGTFMWLMEEIGELSTALRLGNRENLDEEFADVLAWLATIANVSGVNLENALRKKYGGGCPGCHKLVCICPDAEKP